MTELTAVAVVAGTVAGFALCQAVNRVKAKAASLRERAHSGTRWLVLAAFMVGIIVANLYLHANGNT